MPPANRVGSDAKMKPVLCMSGEAGMARIGVPLSGMAYRELDRGQRLVEPEEEIAEPQAVAQRSVRCP